jgi:phosphonatase-like hydrolase
MRKMFVFDMAGTTVDERLLVYRVLFETISRAGHGVTFEDVLRHCGGKEKRQAIRDLFEASEISYDEATVEALYQDFDVRLGQAYETADVGAMPYAREVFSSLRGRGIRVVLDTGYTEALARHLIARLGWRIGEDIDLLVSADQVPRGRPAPDMIELAMRHFGIEEASAVVKIGDTIVDMQEGRNARCGLVVGVLTGADCRDRLLGAGADEVIDTLADLERVVFEAR